MLLEHERYHGLGMDAPASVCSSCLLCRDPDKMPRCSRAADIPKCAFYQGSLVAHLPCFWGLFYQNGRVGKKALFGFRFRG